MSKMNIIHSIARTVIAKVSTPLHFKEGLGVALWGILLFLTACGPDKNHGRIKGKLEGINSAIIQAVAEDIDGRIDTIELKKGAFTYDREVASPVVLTLIYPNFTTTTLVLGPGETVKLKGDASKLSELEIDGNDDNRLITEFRKHAAGKSATEKAREAATFIRSHAGSRAALILFREFFADVEVIEENPTASLLTELEKAHPKDSSVTAMAKRLRPIIATAPGQPAPTFSGKDIKGKTVSNATYRGKACLVVIGGYYDGHFYTIASKIKGLTEKVDTTRLSYLFVSLDPQKATCERNTTYTPLPGHMICDGKAFDSPFVKTFGARSFPGNILIGKDGKIKARDIPATEWVDRIPGLL